MEPTITIRGARTNNLRNIDLDLPLGRLTVVTGVSGSGKSSLVFDTLYAEGQRRYVQSLSTYARLFLERMDRPDVDVISDIPPALALRQKNSIKNARSNVGSITEINDYLRLLFATIGRTLCPRCGSEVQRDTVSDACARIVARPAAYMIIAPYDIGSRTPEQALAFLAKNGYHRMFHNGGMAEAAELGGKTKLGTTLEVIVDRIVVSGEDSGERVREALEKAFYLGTNRARALEVERKQNGFAVRSTLDFDRRFNCSKCGTLFPEPTPALLSPNSPIGACPACEGFGRTVELDLAKVIPNPKLSLRQGLVAPWRTPAYREMQQWMIECARRRIRLAAPYCEFTHEERSWLLDGDGRAGSDHPHHHHHHHHHAHRHHHHDREWASEEEHWPGIRGFFRWLERRRYKTHVRILLAKYRRFVTCSTCGGSKLKPEALNVRIAGKNIAQLGQMPIEELTRWVSQLALAPSAAARAGAVLRELRNRLGYLMSVGLGYLALERPARTLSGGEAQRIHLASALGSLLTGTLYVLDEPTVGLHARDSRQLLDVLRSLRDLGNTVVVVEHDPIMIAGADYNVELGPGGGREGGSVVHAGPPRRSGNNGGNPGRALLMRAVARERRFVRGDPAVRIVGAREHNLKNINVAIPLGRLVCVTGVSGSGKSTLVEDVLYNNFLMRSGTAVSDAGACKRIDGLERLAGIVHMGQETLLRSTRSNPATYLKIHDFLRKLFAATAEARRLGITARDFSFNVPGGRCERCHGMGTVTVEMHFMADLEVRCEACEGRRFQSHVLGIRYHGLNINEVLALTIDEARAFFAARPEIVKRLNALSAVGLGYLQLGQATSTLSGGEAQRLRLSAFLLEGMEPAAGANRRMFILDEPTTGLSSSDIKNLMRVFTRLVDAGHTLLVIEHNLELIAQADYIIDLGPEGGYAGGRIVAQGNPLRIAANEDSYTGRELRQLFGLQAKAGENAVRSALRTAAGF